MLSLSKPTDTASSTFRTCISTVIDSDLKARLALCESDIVAAESDFETRVQNNTLHELPEHSMVGTVPVKEMKKLYTYRMLHASQPGRKIYDRIKSLAKHDRCPLCNQRVVGTLDHHLPKAKYPLFVVTPINLIPSCRACNTEKLQAMPTNSGEETLHPYFDNVENELWLKAKLPVVGKTIFAFYTDPPSSWDKVLKDRVANHLSILKLNKLYASHAAQELQNIKFRLTNLLNNGGSNAVKVHLLESAKSCQEANINSWQTSMYTVAASTTWFCEGGFKSI